MSLGAHKQIARRVPRACLFRRHGQALGVSGTLGEYMQYMHIDICNAYGGTYLAVYCRTVDTVIRVYLTRSVVPTVQL